MFSTKFWPQLLFTSFVGAAYVGVSVVLIMSSKWLLIDEGGFPHPEALAVLHLFTAAVLSWLLYFIRPSMFTAMQSFEVSHDMRWRFIPISIAFAGSLLAGNLALVYSPVSVLQVMKQGNVVFIFLGSLALGLEKAGKASAALLVLIVCGVSTCVLVGPTVSLLGIAFQLGSQCCEVGKVLMQNVLMSSKGHRLDPLSMILFLAPVSALVACTIFLGRDYSSLGVVYANFLRAWPMLLINTLAAFGLNLVVAWTIWVFNATGFLVAGIVKDVAIVLVASMAFGEHFSRLQCAGFSIALLGISLYGSFKIRRGVQNKGLPAARHAMTSGTKSEKQPILKHETP